MEVPKTAELSVLQHHVPEIRDAVTYSGSFHQIADELMAKSFIDPKRERDIMEHRGLSPSEKSRLLVNTVIVQVKVDPNQFQVFIGILEERPSLKKLAAKLQEEYKNPSTAPSPTLTQQDLTSSSDSDSNPEELKWALLIPAIVEDLDASGNALPRMKTALEHSALSKAAKRSSAKSRKRKSKTLGECARIVKSREYKEAQTVQELFGLLAPLCGWDDYWHLGFILEASSCKPAMEKFKEFLRIREEDRSVVPNGELLTQSEPEVLTKRRGLPPQEVEHPEIFGACVAGNLEEVLQCLSLGVDVNEGDEHGQTPLMVASTHSHVAIVQALRERSADFHTQVRLGIRDFKVVREALHSIRRKWKSLGVALDCSKDELDTIEHDYRTSDQCLDEMLDLWLRRSRPRPTWEAIIVALKKPSIGEEGVSVNIAEKY